MCMFFPIAFEDGCRNIIFNTVSISCVQFTSDSHIVVCNGIVQQTSLLFLLIYIAGFVSIALYICSHCVLHLLDGVFAVSSTVKC